MASNAQPQASPPGCRLLLLCQLRSPHGGSRWPCLGQDMGGQGRSSREQRRSRSMEGAEARRDTGAEPAPHLPQAPSGQECVPACVPAVFPCFSLLSLQRELGVCQSSAVCRTEGATSAVAVLKRSCDCNTGQGTRTHSCLPGGHLPLLTLQLGLNPALWGPSYPPPGGFWCAGSAGTGCPPALGCCWFGAGAPDPLVQECSTVCAPHLVSLTSHPDVSLWDLQGGSLDKVIGGHGDFPLSSRGSWVQAGTHHLLETLNVATQPE